MLSAMSFDPRLIWDKQDKARNNPPNEEVMDEVASH
jgi:paraquat-inducible protein A